MEPDRETVSSVVILDRENCHSLTSYLNSRCGTSTDKSREKRERMRQLFAAESLAHRARDIMAVTEPGDAADAADGSSIWTATASSYSSLLSSSSPMCEEEEEEARQADDFLPEPARMLLRENVELAQDLGRKVRLLHSLEEDAFADRESLVHARTELAEARRENARLREESALLREELCSLATRLCRALEEEALGEGSGRGGDGGRGGNGGVEVVLVPRLNGERGRKAEQQSSPETADWIDDGTRSAGELCRTVNDLSFQIRLLHSFIETFERFLMRDLQNPDNEGK